MACARADCPSWGRDVARLARLQSLDLWDGQATASESSTKPFILLTRANICRQTACSSELNGSHSSSTTVQTASHGCMADWSEP